MQVVAVLLWLPVDSVLYYNVYVYIKLSKIQEVIPTNDVQMEMVAVVLWPPIDSDLTAVVAAVCSGHGLYRERVGLTGGDHVCVVQECVVDVVFSWGCTGQGHRLTTGHWATPETALESWVDWGWGVLRWSLRGAFIEQFYTHLLNLHSFTF